MKSTKETITEETTLEKAMELEGGEEVLRANGVPCVSCPMAKMEIGFLKLGEVCRQYGIELEKVLKELNELKEK